MEEEVVIAANEDGSLKYKKKVPPVKVGKFDTEMEGNVTRKKCFEKIRMGRNGKKQIGMLRNQILEETGVVHVKSVLSQMVLDLYQKM